MANGLFSRFNPFVSPEEQAGAEQYIAESRLGELPALGETVGETAAFQPTAFGEGGTTMIDTSTPATQEDLMQAGFTQMGLPILGGASVLGTSVGTQPSLVGAPRTTTTIPRLVGTGTPTFTGTVPPRPMPGTQLAPPTQLPAPAPSTAPRPVTGTARTVGSQLARTGAGTAARGLMSSAVPTAATILAIEEAPKLFGSEKSTSQILTELAATTPEERAGAREYAALGADLPGLPMRETAEPVQTPTAAAPTPNLSQFMRYDDAAETEQFVDPQGRLRIRMKDSKKLAPQYRDYEAEARAREERLGRTFAQPTPVDGTAQEGVPAGEAAEDALPDQSELPSEIREIVTIPTQMRTPDQQTRLARFLRTTLGRRFGGEAGIKESMMSPLERRIAEAELELQKQRAADLEAGRQPSDVTYRTNPETGLIEQYVDGQLRQTFKPREEKTSEGETFSQTQEAGIKAVMDATGNSREEVIATLKEQGKL